MNIFCDIYNIEVNKEASPTLPMQIPIFVYNLCYCFNKTSSETNEFSFCHKLCFSNPYIFATRSRSRPLIFQNINFVGSNSLNLKYQSFTLSGCKDKGIRKFEFVAKTQFLCKQIHFLGFSRNNVRYCRVTHKG